MSHTTLLGAHMSIAGGYHKALERGKQIGCSTIQLFTKNNKSWFGKAIPDHEAELFKQTLKETGISHIMAHAGYLINLASSNKQVALLSKKSLKHELERCHILSIPYLVFHPGSYGEGTEQQALEHIAYALNDILETTPGKTMILLETMAGQGTSVGHSFENLKAIYDLCTHKDRIGICLDTCHVFAAGYDISTPQGYHETLRQFDKVLGYRLLKAIHLNDSRGTLGCHKDRHAMILEGHIGRPTFEAIMNDRHLAAIPKVLETPAKTLEDYGREIVLLTSFID